MSGLRRIADYFGLYARLRYSKFYDWLAQMRKTPYACMMASDRAFFGRLFADQGIRDAFDVGANVGDKARVFSDLAERVVCVEADPVLVNILRYRFRSQTAVVVESTAVGDRHGNAQLYRKHFSGFNTLSEKWSEATAKNGVVASDAIQVSVTTLDGLIEKHGVPQYIKIDIEGYELPAIRGLSAALPVLSFEANLPMFLLETREIVYRLLTLDAAYRFNFRIADETTFRLPGPVEAHALFDELDQLGNATCDVFALREGFTSRE